jgi:hypothetical protein
MLNGNLYNAWWHCYKVTTMKVVNGGRMKNTHYLLAALLMALIAAPVMGASVPISAQLNPTISLTVTSYIPSPWILQRGDVNVLPSAFQTVVSNDIAANLVISGANAGFLLKDGTGTPLADPFRIPSVALLLSGTPQTLKAVPAGGSTDTWDFSQPIEPSDTPGIYSGSLIIEALAA